MNDKFQMGMNSIGPDGAMALLSAVDKNDNSAITLLDLSVSTYTMHFAALYLFVSLILYRIIDDTLKEKKGLI